MKKQTGLYSITHTATGRQYIGSAVCIGGRWAAHRCDLNVGRHHNQKLQRAWDKYGAECFEFSVIELVAEKEKLIEREQFHMDTCKPFFNIAPIAQSSLGIKHGPEYGAKISAAKKGCKNPKLSAAKKGLPLSELACQNAVKANKGKKRSEETKQRMSASMRGKKKSAAAVQKGAETRKLLYLTCPEYRQKCISRNKGRIHSVKTRTKRAAAIMNKWQDPEYRAKVSASLKGKPKPAGFNPCKNLSPEQTEARAYKAWDTRRLLIQAELAQAGLVGMEEAGRRLGVTKDSAIRILRTAKTPLKHVHNAYAVAIPDLEAVIAYRRK